MSALSRLKSVIPIKVVIRNKEKRKRLGAIFLNIERKSTEYGAKIRIFKKK